MAKRRSGKLYTLSEAAAKTGISVASLRRYRSAAADRIPSVGEGRRARYPEPALEVFRSMKEEGLARRGHGRRSGDPAAGSAPEQKTAPAGAGSRSRGAAGATPGGGGRRKGRRQPARAVRSKSRRARGAGGERDKLLTLVQIGKMTGISYPTLLRYVRLHLDRLPHTGVGRKRRFRPEAVGVFQELRAQSRRGRRGGARTPAAASSLARQMSRLERGQRDLARQIGELRKAIRRPLRIRLER